MERVPRVTQFELLYGSTTDDKNDVVKEVSWVLTGDREDKSRRAPHARPAERASPLTATSCAVRRYTYKGVGVG